MAIGHDLTTSVADLTEGKGHGLGDRITDRGDEYVFVQANGAITAGDIVIISEAYQADQLDTTSSGGAIGDAVGVAKVAMADNEYGWVQIYGTYTDANVATGATANTVLNSTSTAGRIDDDATSGSETITGLYATETAASNAADVVLRYPWINATL